MPVGLCKQIRLSLHYFFDSDSKSSRMPSGFLVLKYKMLESKETGELRCLEDAFSEHSE